MRPKTELLAKASAASFVEDLFDRIPDVVFFIKDHRGRYVVVNRTLVQRCGFTDKSIVIGRTTAEVFPDPLGESYLAQDLAVVASGKSVIGRLELHLYPSGAEGWCLTDKIPITGSEGETIGLVGISRDLRVPAEAEGLEEVAAAVSYLEKNFDRPLRVEELARQADLSLYQLNRRIRAIYGITPSQLIAKVRIEAASQLLSGSDRPIGDVALACGYCDQSAFARHFKAACGLTPSQYRERVES